ncbi:ABC transporter substrate-binding protein [Nocardioidaceae bacterium]|nr:ABC transporter substrate-binding protein [Nocardioidaceae bacterium]
MRSARSRRGLTGIAALAVSAIALTGCASEETGGTQTASGTSPGEGRAECSQLTQFGDLTGTEVRVFTSIVQPESDAQQASYELFTECTGAEVAYEGSQEFETQLSVRVRGGNAPDIAYVPQPGLVNTMVATGQTVPAPQPVSDNVDEFFPEIWREYGTVDGTFYAAPLGANVKSFVWYSPSFFEENGYEIPETWDEMTALSEEIAQSGTKPWCAGIESGTATGWTVTDWLEDAILRDQGADFYDQWVNHEVPFDDQAVADSLDRVGGILKNGDFVNGGFGDVRSIASTSFQDAGYPILSDNCAMMRQASFYAAQWASAPSAEGGNAPVVAEDGDVFAFYLPVTQDNGERPVLGGGEFVLAFDDRPEVQAFQTYLSSDIWANEKAEATPDGGWVSANTGLDINLLNSPIDVLSAETLQDPNAVFRFDGSDQMPSAVGAGSFWTQMTDWITGKSTGDALTQIEESWPTS